MTRSVAEIAADLGALTARDFDFDDVDARGQERLVELCDELLALDDPAAGAPVLFDTLERLDGADLGAPGPLVHTLESWLGRYEFLLASSVQRKPVPLTVLMINRIVNTKPPDAQRWLALLKSVVDHPAASSQTKVEAERFVEYQGRAGGA